MCSSEQFISTDPSLQKKSLYPCRDDSFYMAHCIFANSQTVNLTTNLSFSREDKCESCPRFQQIVDQLKKLHCHGNRKRFDVIKDEGYHINKKSVMMIKLCVSMTYSMDIPNFWNVVVVTHLMSNQQGF